MLNIAHRGASAEAPENTLLAFRRALELGADGVELDVHRCKSGELMVIHDDTVTRTTDGKGRVSRLTLPELKHLRIEGSERIPTLNEALDVLKGRFVFVEIKHGNAALDAAALLEARVRAGWPRERLWLISFNHRALKAVRAAYPKLAIAFSYNPLKLAHLKQAGKAGVRGVTANYRKLKALHVEEAHALGLELFCWTVNQLADIKRMKSLGVDGIMSDHPLRVK